MSVLPTVGVLLLYKFLSNYSQVNECVISAVSVMPY